MNAILLIKNSRRLTTIDFLQAFANMPGCFEKSFIRELHKVRKHFPSSGFQPKFNNITLDYNDIRPLISKEGVPLPYLRNTPPWTAGVISLTIATGVPIPDQSKVPSDYFMSRTVKVCMCKEKGGRLEYIGNTCFLEASWKPQFEDQWNFNTDSAIGTNPIIYRFQQGNDGEIYKIIFEFTVTILVQNQGEKQTPMEMSSCWAVIEVEELKRGGIITLELKGGNPLNEVNFGSEDVRTGRKGVHYLLHKLKGSRTTSQLKLRVKNWNTLPREEQVQIEFMPEDCLLNKGLLYFISIYRQYLGSKLLEGSQDHCQISDMIIATFPKIIDSPDIVTELIRIWNIDVMKGSTKTQKTNCYNMLFLQFNQFVSQLNMVINSTEFRYEVQDPTRSASGWDYGLEPMKTLLFKRKKLIQYALRADKSPQMRMAGIGTVTSRAQEVDPSLERITTFTPFKVEELFWDEQYGSQLKILSRKQYSKQQKYIAIDIYIYIYIL